MILVGAGVTTSKVNNPPGVHADSTTINVATYASANGWTNGTKYPTIVSGPFTLTGSGGANSTKYYTASPGTWRFYSSDSPKGNIVITGDATVAAITAVTTSGATTSWSYNGKTATMGALSANVSISGFTITYTPAGTTFGTLNKIEVANPADKLSFYVGETFNSEGLTIKAIDGSTPPVEEIVTSGFTTNRAGLVLTASHKPSLLVTVSYTRNSVTKTTTYSVAVADAPVLKTYKEVTSIAELYLGSTYIIAGVKSGTPYTMSTTQNANNRASVETIYFDGDIKETEDTQKIELVEGNKANTYGLKAINGATVGQYLKAASNSANYLHSESTLTDNSSWVLTFTGGVLSAVSQGSYSRNVLKFNSTNNPPLFSCYASGQADVSLHIDEDTIPISGFGTLNHITVNTASAQTTYYVGEKFNTTGLVVTAFDTKPEPDFKVVADFSTSIAEDAVLSTSGTHSVTVSYSEGGVTKTTTYSINVLRAQTYTQLGTANDIRYNQNYALGSADGAASTTVSSFAGEVSINYNETTNSFTSVSNMQLVTLGIGAVKGSYTLQLLNGANTNKYYSWTSGNELNASDEISEASSWFISFVDGTLVIENVSETGRYIGHNHTNTRFAAYGAGGTTPKASLFMDFGSYDTEAEAMALATAVNTGIGNNAAGNCHIVYDFLSDVYSRLSVDGKECFDTNEDISEIEDARIRMAYLAAWTAANPDSGDSALNISSSRSIYIIVVVSILGILTLAGYYFIRKRPKEEIN